ncbi:MAG: peptidylprolyl isomerase [Cystobacterineae bacterium]|nr:peptidylprolyl isomerase [Cystobacterineae bacterium]
MRKGLLGCFLFCFAAFASSRELVDRVAAVVNGEIIPWSALEKRLRQEIPSPHLLDAEKYRAAQKLILSSLIDEKLMDAQTKALALETTNEELNLAVEDILRQNNVNLEQLESLLAREGLTLVAYRAQLKAQLGRMKLIRVKLQSKVNVTDEDVKAAYERWAKSESSEVELHARHILIRLDSNADAQATQAALAKAQNMVSLARAPGADFAALAKQHGEGSSAAMGGDLGYFKRGVMMPEFENAAFALETGQVSEPVRTNLGFHIIKMEDRRALPLASLEEVKESLRQKLIQEQMETYARHYSQELRAQAIIEEKL